MSKPQQPRNQFMTMLMLMAVIYLGTTLLFPRGPADTRTSDDLFKILKKDNAEMNDVEALQTYPLYSRKLGEERSKNGWSQDEVDRRDLEGAVLVAHAKYKGAALRDGIPEKSALVHKKLNDSWLLLQQKFDALHDRPVWQQPFNVTPEGKVSQKQVSAEQLYDTVVADLSVRNKTDLVWGLFPGYHLIDFLVKVTGALPALSYWFAAFLLALVVRIAVLPWSVKQYRFGRQMMQLQPYVKEIQQKFKDKRTGQIPPDKQAQASAETMALYREYGVNPLAGCGSAFIQLPFFWAVYQCMQLYKFEFVKGTFLWIHPGAGKFLGLTLAPNLGQTDKLLIIIYGVSMIVSQWLMPVSDPTQVRQQRIIGLVMSVMVTFFMFGYPLPAAFTLYWVFANVLATVQALHAYRMPAPPLVKVQTVKGGTLPKRGFMERIMNQMEEQQRSAQKNGTGSNGKAETPVDPEFFGKTGSPRSRKKK